MEKKAKGKMNGLCEKGYEKKGVNDGHGDLKDKRRKTMMIRVPQGRESNSVFLSVTFSCFNN